MRIATYNVNGINGRLANLLGWLAEAEPDIVCLQELKAPDEKFPSTALAAAGYGAVWHGQKSWNGVAILARSVEPVETRRGLPGDPDDTHSRYIEAAIGGVLVGCLYLPSGNPAPGPKFDYKLRWFDRLNWGRKPLLLIGFGILPVRAVLYTLSDSSTWLIGVQLLDGVGAGIFGAITPLVLADLMRGTGRYNIAQGVVATVQGIGASSSGLVAGLIGYTAAFVEAAVLAAIALAVLVILMPETATPEPRQALHRRSDLEDRPRSEPSPLAECRRGEA